MLQSKKMNMLLALILAILLWAYVTGSVDPNTTKKFASVPITIINADSLTDNNLAIDYTGDLKVDITLIATRAELKNITTNDIKVTADVYGRHKGNNYVTLDIQLPKGAKVDSKSEDKVLVNIDDLVSKDIAIKTDVKGSLPEGSTISKATIEPTHVMVYGSKSNIEKVSYVSAIVDAKKLSNDTNTLTAKVQPVDKKGNKVNFVTTSRKNVEVTASLAKFKKVELLVNVIGKESNKYDIESIDIPKTIEIEGTKDKLAGVTSIQTQDIDVSKLEKSTKIKIEPILPEGITVKPEYENLTVDVVIKGTIEKTFEINSDEIDIDDVGVNINAIISDKIEVTVTGRSSVVEKLKNSDIDVFVSAKGLQVGSHKVKVNVAIDADDLKVKVAPTTITLLLEEK